MQQLETVGPGLGIALVGMAGGEVEPGPAPRHGNLVDGVVLGPRHGRQVDDGFKVVGLHCGGQLARVFHKFLNTQRDNNRLGGLKLSTVYFLARFNHLYFLLGSFKGRQSVSKDHFILPIIFKILQ